MLSGRRIGSLGFRWWPQLLFLVRDFVRHGHFFGYLSFIVTPVISAVMFAGHFSGSPCLIRIR
jgi:hypothetical protein